LEKLGIENKKAIRVLDIGCGPGNWALSIAKYNTRATVIGIDPNPKFLSLARFYRRNLNCKNVQFCRLSFQQAAREFQDKSFDYVFAVSLLQYMHEDQFFKLASNMLRENGQLVMFWTHGIGYYLWDILHRLSRLNLKLAVFDTHALIRAFLRATTGSDYSLFSSVIWYEHPIVYSVTRTIAEKYGIELKRAVMTALCDEYYPRQFLLLPIVLNLVGRKSWHPRINLPGFSTKKKMILRAD
jgi:SAM-dependent methyltransferase